MEIGKAQIDERKIDDWCWLRDSSRFDNGYKYIISPLIGGVYEGIEGTRREKVVIYNRIWK